MKQVMVFIVIAVLASGLFLLLGCGKTEQQKHSHIVVEDNTGNEATPVARMLSIKSGGKNWTTVVNTR